MARLERERAAAEARASARQAARAAHADQPSPQTPQTQPVPAATQASSDDPEAKKRAIIQAALERARKKKEEMAKLGAGPKNTDHVSAAVQAQIDSAEQRRRRLGLTDDENASHPGEGDRSDKPA
jgi:electron transport complex protein RnfB